MAVIILTVVENDRIVSCETIRTPDVMTLRGTSYWLVPATRENLTPARLAQAPLTPVAKPTPPPPTGSGEYYYRSRGDSDLVWHKRVMSVDDYEKLKEALLDVITESEGPVVNPGVLAKEQLGLTRTGSGRIPIGPALQQLAKAGTIKKTPSGWTLV